MRLIRLICSTRNESDDGYRTGIAEESSQMFSYRGMIEACKNLVTRKAFRMEFPCLKQTWPREL